MNNAGSERALIAPRRGCAIYLRLSGSAAVSFVTLAPDESLCMLVFSGFLVYLGGPL